MDERVAILERVGKEDGSRKPGAQASCLRYAVILTALGSWVVAGKMPANRTQDACVLNRHNLEFRIDFGFEHAFDSH